MKRNVDTRNQWKKEVEIETDTRYQHHKHVQHGKPTNTSRDLHLMNVYVTASLHDEIVRVAHVALAKDRVRPGPRFQLASKEKMREKQAIKERGEREK